jgi:hypothetical protein
LLEQDALGEFDASVDLIRFRGQSVTEEDCIPILHHSSVVIHEGSELTKVFTSFRVVH